MTKRGGKGNPVIFGTRDDNVPEGTDGKDLIFGFKGDDILDGRAGNDILFGGKGNDSLDGGSGNDLAFGGKGDDGFNYTLSENEGAKDHYDGGKGFDTLQLTLTSAERQLVQDEIDAFRAFLDGGGEVFKFESFGLTVRGFEDLVIVEIGGGGNTAPVAVDDLFDANEDVASAGNVLSNDTDAEDGAPAIVSTVNGEAANVGAEIELASGALLKLEQDGSFSYDPNGQFEHLAVGDTFEDSFTYTALDSEGAESNAATAKVVVQGENDAPAAIKVAVVGANSSINSAVVGQLTDDLALFDFEATAILIESGTDWSTAFAGYDVVVLGEDGVTVPVEHDNAELFSALNTFLLGGGGVVTTGLFAGFAYGFAGAETVSPVKVPDLNGVAAVPSGSPITVTPLDAAGDFIAGDIADVGAPGSYAAQGFHEVAVAGKDDTAHVLAADSLGRVAIAYDSSAAGRTVYLGSLHMHTFGDAARVNETTVDELFERAVAWAAGEGPSAGSTVVSSAEDLLGYGVDSTLSSTSTDADALL